MPDEYHYPLMVADVDEKSEFNWAVWTDPVHHVHFVNMREAVNWLELKTKQKHAYNDQKEEEE